MEIALKHLAPSLQGMTVEVTVNVVAVDRRKISFEVAARDEWMKSAPEPMRASSWTSPRPSNV